MTEHEASRTLVKSPPELWAECSEAASLARHLGQFGEIRITKLEPETAVAWEGEEVCGTVRLEPSGWGTKVILTASATEQQNGLAPEAEKPDTEKTPIQEPIHGPRADEPEAVEEPPGADEPEAAQEPSGADEPEAVEKPPPPPDPEPEPLPPAAAAPTTSAAPTPRRGLIARFMALFQPPEPEPAPAPDATASTPPPLTSTPPPEPRPAAAPRPAATTADPPDPPDPPEPTDGPPDPSDPELTGAVDPGAVLTAALDSLGQAHHRPFSRA